MSTIKMFAMLPRRECMSAQEFHDHWRHPHGTFGAKISTVHRYVQSHRIETDLLAQDQAPYDGIVEVWFENAEDALGLPDHPTYRKYLVPDEPRFIDMERIQYVFTEEEVVVSGRTPGPELEEADLEWDPARRPLSVKLIQLYPPGTAQWELEEDHLLAQRIGALRHVRCRPSKRLHPDGAALAGLREFWWPTLTALESGARAATEAWQQLLGRPSGVINVVVQAERMT